jgi:serine protease inhibitor
MAPPHPRLVWAVLLAPVVFLASCDVADLGPDLVQPRELTPLEAEVVAADNAFTFDLFREVTAGDPGANVFISPFSASMALGMTLNGARGETFEAMREALRKSHLAQGEINEAYRGLLDLVPHLDRHVDIAIANSVWSEQTFPVEQDFLQALRQYFDAEARSLDFRDPASVDVINDWVSRETRGRIPDLIDSIPAGVVMYLINALYFKGAWRHPFDPEDTRPTTFHREDGTTTSVQMMHRSGKYAFFANQELTALDLPYGDSLYSMTVLLPNPGRSVDDLIAGLGPELWSEMLDGFWSLQVDVGFPRLKLEYDVLLNDALKALGMGISFSGGADFSGINSHGGIFISRVLHKTFLEVNEEGTEAAAATAVEVFESLPPQVILDRPFVLAIRERTTGAILFIGRITDPDA